MQAVFMLFVQVVLMLFMQVVFMLFMQVLQLEKQVYIWIGDSPASLSELAIGIPSMEVTASRYYE